LRPSLTTGAVAAASSRSRSRRIRFSTAWVKENLLIVLAFLKLRYKMERKRRKFPKLNQFSGP